MGVFDMYDEYHLPKYCVLTIIYTDWVGSVYKAGFGDGLRCFHGPNIDL